MKPCGRGKEQAATTGTLEPEGAVYDDEDAEAPEVVESTPDCSRSTVADRP